MTRIAIRGYTDRPSVAPGETIDFKVSSDVDGQYDVALVRLIHGDVHPDGPGYKEERVPSPIDGRYPPVQSIRGGD